MITWLTQANVILPDRILKGYVAVENGRIAAVGPDEPVVSGQDRVIEVNGHYLSPGFVELHTHGAGGCDFMDGTASAFVTAAMTHLQHGTTTLLPTVLGDSREQALRSIDILREVQQSRAAGPHMPGLHLEGPYLNVRQKGAISENHLRLPDPAEYETILAYGAGLIARWTVAVELDGALALGRRLRQLGILPSIGHSDAEYAQVAAAFAQGYTHVTHLYSAMSTIVRRGGFRYPGVIESAYCLEDMTVEVIADGCHLPVEMLGMVYRLKGVQKVCLTSDSMRCAGLETTEGVLGGQGGGQRVIIEDGVAKLPDRSAFAGSIATDDRLVRVMHQQAGVPLVDCVRMMSLTPAGILGIAGRTGSIEAGKDADLVVFDEDIRILGVMVGGNGLTGIMQ